MEVIGPPQRSHPATGEGAEDAFHVVVPSLPGFAFSDKPVETGWDVNRDRRGALGGADATALAMSAGVAAGRRLGSRA